MHEDDRGTVELLRDEIRALGRVQCQSYEDRKAVERTIARLERLLEEALNA